MSNENEACQEGKIVISGLYIYARIFSPQTSIIKISMSIFNNSEQITELDYEFPLYLKKTPIYLSAFHENQSETVIFDKSTTFSVNKFDDKVSAGDLCVRLSQIDEITTLLTVANLNPKSKISIITVFEGQLINDNENLYFKVPLVESYQSNLHPNYKFFSEVLINDIKSNKIQFKYNGYDHTNDIDNFTKITASDVSFQNDLCIKMPLKKPKQTLISTMKAAPNVIFFIDDRLIQQSYFQNLLVSFLGNFGTSYQFNIVIFGQHSCILSKTMIEKSDDFPDQISLFFEKLKNVSFKSTFAEAFTTVFGNNIKGIQLLNDSKKYIKEDKELTIQNVCRSNTIAVCFGSIRKSEFIECRKAKTFLVDPLQICNTHAFAIKNNFHYEGPFFESENDLQKSLDRIIFKSKIDFSEEEISQDQKDEQKLICNFFERKESDKTKFDFKIIVNKAKSNALFQNMNYEKLKLIMNEIEKNDLMSVDDVFYFLDKIGNDENNDYSFLKQILNEKSFLFHSVRQFIVIKLFGFNDFDAFFLNPFFKYLCDRNLTVDVKLQILNSIQPSRYIHFHIDNPPINAKSNYITTSQSISSKSQNASQLPSEHKNESHKSDNCEISKSRRKESINKLKNEIQNNKIDVSNRRDLLENDNKKNNLINGIAKNKNKNEKISNNQSCIKESNESKFQKIVVLQNPQNEEESKALFDYKNKEISNNQSCIKESNESIYQKLSEFLYSQNEEEKKKLYDYKNKEISNNKSCIKESNESIYQKLSEFLYSQNEEEKKKLYDYLYDYKNEEISNNKSCIKESNASKFQKILVYPYKKNEEKSKALFDNNKKMKLSDPLEQKKLSDLLELKKLKDLQKQKKLSDPLELKKLKDLQKQKKLNDTIAVNTKSTSLKKECQQIVDELDNIEIFIESTTQIFIKIGNIDLIKEFGKIKKLYDNAIKTMKSLTDSNLLEEKLNNVKSIIQLINRFKGIVIPAIEDYQDRTQKLNENINDLPDNFNHQCSRNNEILLTSV